MAFPPVQHSNISKGQTHGIEKALEGSSLEQPLTDTWGRSPVSSSQCLAREE